MQSMASTTTTTVQTQTPNQQHTIIPSNNINPNNKRPFVDHHHHVTLLQNSPYFKMRKLLSDIRPLFLEVVRAPDFQNAEAAYGIHEKMKLMVDLCRQNTVGNVPLVKCSNNGTGGPVMLHGENKHTGRPPIVDSSFTRPNEEKRFPVANNHEKTETNRIPGTYIVGNSAFGWNFITFHGTKPQYYGRTKESFRAGK